MIEKTFFDAYTTKELEKKIINCVHAQFLEYSKTNLS